MTSNVGTVDRALRALVGLILLGLPFMSGAALFQSTTATLGAIIVGAVLIATSAMKFCPLYRVLGLRTCKVS